MDLDFDELWEEGQSDTGVLGDTEMENEDEFEEEEADMSLEWGLTDGESESMSSSEGETTMEEEEHASLGTWPRHGSALWVVQLTLVALSLLSAGSGSQYLRPWRRWCERCGRRGPRFYCQRSWPRLTGSQIDFFSSSAIRTPILFHGTQCIVREGTTLLHYFFDLHSYSHSFCLFSTQYHVQYLV